MRAKENEMVKLLVQRWDGEWLVGRHPLGDEPKGQLEWGIRVNDVVAACPTQDAAEAARRLLSGEVVMPAPMGAAFLGLNPV